MDPLQRLQNIEEDRRKLLSIFPLETWQHILESTEDSDTLLNCAKMAPFLEKLLEPQRTAYLFFRVLQQLDKQGYLKPPSNSRSPPILKLRLVCSAWKNAVNNFLELRPYEKYQQRCDPAYLTHFRFYKFTLEKLEREIIPEFSNLYYRNHCPFPSRSLELIEKPRHEPIQNFEIYINRLEEYRTAVENLLEKVGHHFWHAVIRFGPGPRKPGYCRLQKYLELMTNLRSILVENRQRKTTDCCLDVSKICVPNLNMICVQVDYKSKVCHQLFRAAENAKIVEIKRVSSWTGNHNGNEFPFGWIKNPEKLAIDIFSAKEFEDLHGSWKLKVLRLSLEDVKAGTLGWSTIFKKLEAYQETLEELVISLPREMEIYDKWKIWKSSRKPWNMASLKILDFKTENFCSLDFLLGLQNLKKLTLKMGSKEEPMNFWVEDKQKDKIDIRSFDEGGLVWDLIPNLNQVFLDPGYGSTPMKYRRGRPPVKLTDRDK